MITVTGRALSPAPGAAAYATTTVGRDALVDAPSGQLENPLFAIPGFQQFRRSDSRVANPTSQGVTLRGIGGNATSRTLVLLDGVPVLDPFFGFVPFSGIAPESLAAVRATLGGGSGGFGAGALSGTLELISAGPTDRTSGAHARYGSRDNVDLGAALVETVGTGFVAIDAAYAEGDGFFPVAPEDQGAVDTASPFEQTSITARAVFAAGPGEIQVRGSYFEDDRQRGQALVTSGIEGADASIRYVADDVALPFEALAYVQMRDFNATFARTAPDRSTEQPALDQFRTPSTGLGIKAEVRPTFGAHNLRIGGDWRRTVGETNEKFDFDGTELTAFREAGGRNDIVGAFIEDDWQLTENLIVTAGARLDHWWIDEGRFIERGARTSFPLRTGFEPTGRLGVAYDATGALKLRGAAYLGWRLPTLNELYRPFRVGPDGTASNPDLSPERSRGVEAGFDYQPLSTANLSVTGFYVRAENAIANITLDSGPGVFPQLGFVFGSFRQRLNLDAIDAAGVEAIGTLALGPVDLKATYAFTDATQDGEGLTAAQDGFHPPQVPRHRVFLSADANVFDLARIGATLRYSSVQFEDDLEARPLDDFVQLDAHAAIPLAAGFALTLAAENLTDTDIEDAIDVRGATFLARPRTLWAGLRWRR
ncbi:MAG: TonB-dependent receptor [Pseudomonadota bacterium]